jgi:hypothetical protein
MKVMKQIVNVSILIISSKHSKELCNRGKMCIFIYELAQNRTQVSLGKSLNKKC